MLSSCSGAEGAKLHGQAKVFPQQRHGQLDLMAASSGDNFNATDSSGATSEHSCRGAFHEQHPFGTKLITDHNNNDLDTSATAQHFINANGSIFALSATSSAGAKQQRAPVFTLANGRQLQDLRQNHLDDQMQHEQSARTTPPPLPPPLPNANRDRQQAASQEHQCRRLQYQPIHQQLQRIYGNKLQEFEQSQKRILFQGRQLPLPAKPHHHQQSGAMPQATKAYHGQPAPAVHQQHQQLHYHHQHHKQQQQRQMHEQKAVIYQQHEQTYDSLAPRPAASKLAQAGGQPQPQHQRHHHHHHRDDLHHHDICVIPEEACDSLEDHNELVHEDDDGQLIQLDEHEASAGQQAHSHGAPNMVAERKRQLESLHYATATAAALLNVTASAAAAFAATEKHMGAKSHQIQRRQSQIYSEAYQDFGVNLQRHQHRRQQQQFPSATSQLHYLAKPAGMYESAGQQQGLDVPQHQHASRPARNQQARSMSFRHQQQQRPPPPPLAQRQHMPIYNHQSRPAARRVQSNPIPAQVYAPICQQVEHMQAHSRDARPATGRANFIAPGGGQMLAPVAAALQLQVARAGGQQAQVGRPQLVQHPQPWANKSMLAQPTHGEQAHPVARLHQVAVASSSARPQQPQQLAYGLLVAHGDKKHFQQQQQQVYSGILAHSMLAQQLPKGQPTYHLPQFSSGASSDASGHTGLPLVVDRRLKSASFVDKICQIDLTLFWWSLLTICVIFIAIIVTITRYFKF